MSTSTTTQPPAAQPPPAPTPAGGERSARASLLRAELHRLTARRFVQALVALALLGFVAGVLIAFTQFSKPTEAVLAEARAEMAEQMRLTDEFREECLADESIDEGDRELFCGPPASEQQFELEWFIDTPPFELESGLPGGSIGVAVASAALAFVIGATYVGAEWSTRSMVALLFWEPRRLRVVGVKLVVTVLASLLVGVLGQALWWVAAQVLARTRGTTDVPEDFPTEVLALQGRAVVLVVLAGLLGFAVANLIRNTGAALGIAFAYFVVMENAVRVLAPSLQPFLLSNAAIALVLEGGLSLFPPDSFINDQGNFVEGGREFLLTNLRGGLTLAVVTLVLVAVGAVLFRRRDLH